MTCRLRHIVNPRRNKPGTVGSDEPKPGLFLFVYLNIIKYVCHMEKLKKEIEASGLLKSFIAEKVGISSAHLSMMLSGNATMSADTESRIKAILLQASKIAV